MSISKFSTALTLSYKVEYKQVPNLRVDDFSAHLIMEVRRTFSMEGTQSDLTPQDVIVHGRWRASGVVQHGQHHAGVVAQSDFVGGQGFVLVTV